MNSNNKKTSFRKLGITVMLFAAFAVGGCAHNVAFQDAHYQINSQRYSQPVVAIIDDATLNNRASIRSFMTGIAHSWEAEPGLMLKQVADIELPQMFVDYQYASSRGRIDLKNNPLVLEMAVPSYTFSDFRATVTVRTVASTASNQKLFDRSYTDTGLSQGGKMFWGGAFAMKSAMRQSSIDAYKKIFVRMRQDLEAALREPSVAAATSPQLPASASQISDSSSDTRRR